MGSFYDSVQVRTTHRDAVCAALKRLARTPRRFLVGPVLNGWVGVYPSEGGQDFALAKSLAKKLSPELIALMVHDDDVFAYEYHRNGQRIDRYSSIPDYFGPVTVRQRKALRGLFDTIAHLAADPSRFKALAATLGGPPEKPGTMAGDLLQEFADALGIRNALTSYEYLSEDDGKEGIEGWSNFVHIPDLRAEQAKEAEAESALRRVRDQSLRAGKLLAERGGHRGIGQPSPWLCSDRDGQGFLVAWSCHRVAEPTHLPLEFHEPPWTAEPLPTPWSIDGSVYGLELSPSGRFLAVAHAAGNWKASLWDLREARKLVDVPHIRAVTSVGFLPDESAMYSVSSFEGIGEVAFTPTGAGPGRSLTLSHAQLASVHPSGKWLAVADRINRLVILDVATGESLRVRPVGGRYPLEKILEHALPTLPAVTRGLIRQAAGPRAQAPNVEAVCEQVPQQDLVQGESEALGRLLSLMAEQGLLRGPKPIDEIRSDLQARLATIRAGIQRTERANREMHERGIETVTRIRFDAHGERLIVATHAGIRVHSWERVLAEKGDLVSPIGGIAVGTVEVRKDRATIIQPAYIYDMELDQERNRLLFAGLEGCVRYLDLESGDSGILLEPPGKPPIHRVCLTRDRSTLAIVCHPDQFSRRSDSRAPSLQFWDYRRLCDG